LSASITCATKLWEVPGCTDSAISKAIFNSWRASKTFSSFVVFETFSIEGWIIECNAFAFAGSAGLGFLSFLSLSFPLSLSLLSLLSVFSLELWLLFSLA